MSEVIDAPAATTADPAPAAAPAVAAPAAAPAAASALSAAAPEWTPEAIPEKFRVMGADGVLDPLATMRKVDEHRSNLEKRMGAGDIRPKTADEYKLPESDGFKALGLDDTAVKGFREKAHAAGFSQAQYEFALNTWAENAAALAIGGKTESAETTVAALKEVFKDDFTPNMQGAVKAISAMAEKAGVTYEEADAAIGNNPVAIRMFAALAKEMGEDSTPPAANGAMGGAAQTRDEYVAANWAAYTNPQDPMHKSVTAKAAQLGQRMKGAGDPI